MNSKNDESASSVNEISQIYEQFLLEVASVFFRKYQTSLDAFSSEEVTTANLFKGYNKLEDLPTEVQTAIIEGVDAVIHLYEEISRDNLPVLEGYGTDTFDYSTFNIRINEISQIGEQSIMNEAARFFESSKITLFKYYSSFDDLPTEVHIAIIEGLGFVTRLYEKVRDKLPILER